MLSFVQDKISNIKRTSDKLLSRTIFHILHPSRTATNLYDLLDSPEHLAHLISPNTKKHRHKQEKPKEEPPVRKAMPKPMKKEMQNKFVYRGMESIRS